MEERGRYLMPNRSLKTSVRFKGVTTKHVKAHTPCTAKPGDTLYVNFPKTKDELIIPGSLALTYEMEITLDPTTPGDDANNFPVNNLAANIVSDFKVKVGSQYIYDLGYAYLYNTYKDLWLTEHEIQNSVEQGIQDIALRKQRTDLNTTLKTDVAKLSIKNMLGKRYKIPINFDILANHMPISGGLLKEDITFEMKINKKKICPQLYNGEHCKF